MCRYLFGISLSQLAIINWFFVGENYSGIAHIAIWHAPAPNPATPRPANNTKSESVLKIGKVQDWFTEKLLSTVGSGTQQQADYAEHISEEQENTPSKQIGICAAKKELRTR